eukprot:CAMPEP_0118948508 /NCGR_PEP_ID=MMETSP1169-20130426/47953_1 /TAXON_ID=36882 /ORGANISM="Pyramimonas obovata, Strain CCMP722" /LENGTH=279 /DNA_ID=CAMNT_0006894959 /DNA_START=252 /DNA_END=1087 /DNA_ORIENTATION=-
MRINLLVSGFMTPSRCSRLTNLKLGATALTTKVSVCTKAPNVYPVHLTAIRFGHNASEARGSSRTWARVSSPLRGRQWGQRVWSSPLLQRTLDKRSLNMQAAIEQGDAPRSWGDAKIAVLIDAENTPASYIKGLFDEISKHGTPVVKRCYGDFSRGNMKPWKTAALQYAINVEQQFAYTAGKNATDIRLVIDAMDMLYSPLYNVDEFFLASSDSDFAPLASRLRMAGKKVYAAGSRHTPEGFRNSVDQFIILETLRKEKTVYQTSCEIREAELLAMEEL